MAIYECGKCDGKGVINGFSNICGGVCFSCHGSGKTKYRGRRVLPDTDIAEIVPGVTKTIVRGGQETTIDEVKSITFSCALWMIEEFKKDPSCFLGSDFDSVMYRMFDLRMVSIEYFERAIARLCAKVPSEIAEQIKEHCAYLNRRIAGI